MAMSKQDNPLDKNSDVARNIWLAGLGAYGRAFDEAMNRYEQASKDTPKLFKDLVERGEQLETTTRKKVLPDGLARPSSSIEERIRKVRYNLGLGNSAGRPELANIENKLDSLEAKVDCLLTHFSLNTDSSNH
jgi:hypothetical protein